VVSTSLRFLSVALRDFIDRPIEEEIGADVLNEIEYLLQIALESLYESPRERAETREHGAVRIATDIVERARG
jgi:hypothetical protein